MSVDSIMYTVCRRWIVIAGNAHNKSEYKLYAVRTMERIRLLCYQDLLEMVMTDQSRYVLCAMSYVIGRSDVTSSQTLRRHWYKAALPSLHGRPAIVDLTCIKT